MQMLSHHSAAAARSRLLADKILRPAIDNRIALERLSARLERAGRQALSRLLEARARNEPRLNAVLRQLHGG